jgi:hypothetical protein
MRSAAVILSNLRAIGGRPQGRIRKLRQRDMKAHRRRARHELSARFPSVAVIRRQAMQRSAAPRARPVKRKAAVGFAGMMLH